MNRFDLRALTATILNFNTTAANQDFTESELNTAIQQGYNEVMIEMAENALLAHTTATFDFTWSSGEVTLTVPSSIKGKLLMRLADITSSTTGPRLLFAANGERGELFWKDRNTMQWGTTGPTADVSIRATYQVTAEDLLTDSDIPQGVPTQFHHLIAWTAAIWLKDVAEEGVPQTWMIRHARLTERLWKFMQRGKPLSEVPAIRNWQPVNGDGTDEF